MCFPLFSENKRLRNSCRVHKHIAWVLRWTCEAHSSTRAYDLFGFGRMRKGIHSSMQNYRVNRSNSTRSLSITPGRLGQCLMLSAMLERIFRRSSCEYYLIQIPEALSRCSRPGRGLCLLFGYEDHPHADLFCSKHSSQFWQNMP
jgi:hypothetical protein